MALKRAGATLCLNAGLLSATRHLALFNNSDAEQSGDNYSRTSLAAADTALANNSSIASNGSVVSFATPSATWIDPTTVKLMSAASGGSVLFDADMANNPSAPVNGSSVSWAAGELTFGIGAGTLALEGQRLCLKGGLLNGTRHLDVWDGDPEVSSNESLVTRTSVTLAHWTITNGVATLSTQRTFTGWTVGEDGMWLALYDAATSGNLLWKKSLSNDPIAFPQGGTVSVGADSSLPVTIQITTDD